MPERFPEAGSLGDRLDDAQIAFGAITERTQGALSTPKER